MRSIDDETDSTGDLLVDFVPIFCRYISNTENGNALKA